MLAVLRISFRNARKNLRKTAILAGAIFLCSTLLLIALFSFNGVQRQTLRNYLNVQSGHVAAVWTDLAESDKSSPQRFINVFEPLTYHVKDEADNKAAIAAMTRWMDQHRDQIDVDFPILRRNASIQAGDVVDNTFVLYSMTPNQFGFLQDRKSLQLVAGRLARPGEAAAVMSEEKAKALKVGIGGKVSIKTQTDAGDYMETPMTVTGLYKDGAFYENFYGFVDIEQTRTMFGVKDAALFDSMLIFLHDQGASQSMADSLRTALPQGGPLHAESYLEANTFFNSTPQMIQMAFSIFIVFVLLIIALGMQSTIRMTLFQRLKEIGLMRAIGYSRRLVFLMVFFETFALAVFAFVPGLVVALIYTMFFGSRGVFVGPAASAIFGGQYFYPEVMISQIFTVLAIIIFFALASTIAPGAQISGQRIIDMLARRIRTRGQRRALDRVPTHDPAAAGGAS